jgi:phosphoglycerate dehydrogenase-like enzyme
MNLLVTGAWQQATDYLEELEKEHEVIFMQWENKELPCEYEWVEGIIGNGIFLSHPIERFKNLRYIQLTSAGYDRVPMNYVEEHQIKIHNARGVYSIPMAEFAIAGVLQLYKQARFFSNNQKNHQWIKHRDLLELNGKKVCIVGCGSVGTECAKRFSAFGCHVVGIDLYPREDEYYQEMLHLKMLDDVLSQMDIIVLTLPLTEETHYLMNDGRFKQLKEGAVLVNIARGAVVDTEALIKNLDKLGGAVLDVFEEEPLSGDSELWDREDVILTPHNSFVGEKNQKRLKECILKGLDKNNNWS